MDQIDELIMQALQKARAPVRYPFIIRQIYLSAGTADVSSCIIYGHITHHLQDKVKIIRNGRRISFQAMTVMIGETIKTPFALSP